MLLVKFVPARGSTRSVEPSAVAHPAPNAFAGGGGDARVGYIERVVISKAPVLHVTFGHHVHQILIVQEREVSQPPLGHGEISKRLPEITREPVKQGHPRGAGPARGDDVLGSGELPRNRGHAIVSAAKIAPIIFGARGRWAVGPVEEML